MERTVRVGSLFSSGVHIHLVERRVDRSIADHSEGDVVHERVGGLAVVLELLRAALREMAHKNGDAASHLSIHFGLRGDHDKIGMQSLFDEEGDVSKMKTKRKEAHTSLSYPHRRIEESPFQRSRTPGSFRYGTHAPPPERLDDQSGR